MDETRKLRLRRILTSHFGLILGHPNTCQKDAAGASPGMFFSRLSRNYRVFHSRTHSASDTHAIFLMMEKDLLKVILDACADVMGIWAVNREISDVKDPMERFVNAMRWGIMTTQPTVVDESGARAAATVDAGAAWGASNEPPMHISSASQHVPIHQQR